MSIEHHQAVLPPRDPESRPVPDPVLLPAPRSGPRRPQRQATNLSIDLLRSFIAIVDAGSMAQATDRIFLTQSALSLQIKRLEDQLQQRLFDRQGRSLRLTAAGEELATLARQLLALNDHIVSSIGIADEPAPIQIGLVQDFSDTVLASVLPLFRTRRPDARMQLRIGGSAELGALFDRARLDLAFVYGRPLAPRQASVTTLGVEPMRWIGDPALATDPVLKLVLLDQPCAFRSALLDTLDRVGRPYRIVMETPHLPGLTAAIRAGFGVTCRTGAYASFHGLPLLPDGLPALPEIESALIRRDRLSPATAELACLLERSFASRHFDTE